MKHYRILHFTMKRTIPHRPICTPKSKKPKITTEVATHVVPEEHVPSAEEYQSSTSDRIAEFQANEEASISSNGVASSSSEETHSHPHRNMTALQTTTRPLVSTSTQIDIQVLDTSTQTDTLLLDTSTQTDTPLLVSSSTQTTTAHSIQPTEESIEQHPVHLPIDYNPEVICTVKNENHIICGYKSSLSQLAQHYHLSHPNTPLTYTDCQQLRNIIIPHDQDYSTMVTITEALLTIVQDLHARFH